jgi:4-carboxymuconolactone decarboxylase
MPPLGGSVNRLHGTGGGKEMRLSTVEPERMDDSQRAALAEVVAGKRGRIPGPMRAWIHSPEMGTRAQRLGEFLRYDTVLGPVLSELAILVTAKFWSAEFVFNSHAISGRQAGLDPKIIDDIAGGREPRFADAKAQAVFDYATMLHRTHFIPATLHDEAVAALGERGVVELVGLLGYYTLTSMTINAFAFPLPEGAASPFADQTP